MAAFSNRLTVLEHMFNKGAYSGDSLRSGGLGTRVTVDEDSKGFVVEVLPWDDLWVPSPVKFQIRLPDAFPKERPAAACIQCEEKVRSDPRLLMVVEEPIKVRDYSECDPDNENYVSSDEEDVKEKPKLYKSRIDKDGTVNANLFQSRYMGWLEFYTLEVVVHTLRILFRKTDLELAPDPAPYQRAVRFPIVVEGGCYELQGPRPTMEDRVCFEDFMYVSYDDNDTKSTGSLDKEQSGDEDDVGDLTNELEQHNLDTSNESIELSGQTSERGGRKISLHVVLDGHGGHTAADTVSLIFEDLFFGQLANRNMGIRRALYNAIQNAEATLNAECKAQKERTGKIINTSGSTFCGIAIDLDQGVLHCANIGDSRAVLCRNGNAVDLSVDHKATRADEVARVVHTGGFTSYGRVLGMLAVSRALGDPEMKAPNELVSTIPDITTFELDMNDEFVLIACDGVFDVMSSQEAVNYVRHALQVHGGDVEQVSVDLVQHALGPLKSQDNVSVIIVKVDRAPTTVDHSS